ncbi:MAG: hypothetical protein V4628_12990 [Pseudomonadota bacterium]
MLHSLHQKFARLLLISLMAFTLLGVQVIQASPLHQHAQHSVDCALCHLQLSDDAEIQYQNVIVRLALTAFNVLAPSTFYTFLSPSPYQGRAPPHYFL